MRVNGHAIRAIRERSGLTVTALAEASGIRQPTLTNIELGNHGTTPTTARKLAAALKVELAAILADPEVAA